MNDEWARNTVMREATGPDVGWETSPILPKGHSLTGPEGLDFSEDFNWILF